ncbi:MAG: hypothetical protein KDB00_24845, partial [Planctomycetales bacterium]|nr:hypothetical protein [Planctomycetales bacterium]
MVDGWGDWANETTQTKANARNVRERIIMTGRLEELNGGPKSNTGIGPGIDTGRRPISAASVTAHNAGGATQSCVGLRELTIGTVPIGFPVVQAALSGYSDLPMRVIARRHGASYSVCEVMLDQFLLALGKRQKTKHFL